MSADSPTGFSGPEPEPDLAPRPRSFSLLYAALIGLPVALIVLILYFGDAAHPEMRQSPAASAHAAAPAGSLPSLLLLISQTAAVLLAARGAGRILRMFGQPQVIGEMVAGILLGPSFLGWVAPQLYETLFPPHSLGFLNALSQIGIVLFMFIVGLELDPALVHKRRHTAVLTSHASITAPFLLGTALALALYPQFAGPGVEFSHFALFIGAAMSVTAFPVLARILTERKLITTRLGAIAITCAAVDDVTAWCILAAVSALMRSTPEGPPLWLTAVGAIAFTAFVLTIGRRMLARLADIYEQRGHAGGDLMAFVVFAALAGAWITEWLGIHALFGAFLVGVAMPKHPPLMRALFNQLEQLLVVLLVPLFFAFTGLRTRFGLINGQQMWLICGVVILVAIVGNLGGSMVAARATGLQWREALGIGVLMNTRGLIELVFLNVGLELGILTPTLFAMMVLMALATTFMTTPLLALVWPERKPA